MCVDGVSVGWLRLGVNSFRKTSGRADHRARSREWYQRCVPHVDVTWSAHRCGGRCSDQAPCAGQRPENCDTFRGILRAARSPRLMFDGRESPLMPNAVGVTSVKSDGLRFGQSNRMWSARHNVKPVHESRRRADRVSDQRRCPSECRGTVGAVAVKIFVYFASARSIALGEYLTQACSIFLRSR